MIQNWKAVTLPSPADDTDETEDSPLTYRFDLTVTTSNQGKGLTDAPVTGRGL